MNCFLEFSPQAVFSKLSQIARADSPRLCCFYSNPMARYIMASESNPLQNAAAQNGGTVITIASFHHLDIRHVGTQSSRASCAMLMRSNKAETAVHGC